jgi:hypothetical protein
VAIGGVILICLLMYEIAVVRWQLLLSCQGIHLVMHEAGNVTLFSLFLNCFLPGGGFGGDTYRVAYLACRFPDRRTAGVLSIFVDRSIGFYALVSVAAIAAVVRFQIVTTNSALLLLAVSSGLVLVGVPVLAVVVSLCSSRRDADRIGVASPSTSALLGIREAILQSTVLYMKAPRVLFAALGLSLVIQSLAVAAIVILGSAMKFSQLSTLDYAFAAPWGWLAGLFPLTLGGLGVSEAAFDQVCRWLNADGSTVGYATIFLGFRILAMLATLPGMMLWLLSGKSLRVFTDPSEVT